MFGKKTKVENSISVYDKRMKTLREELADISFDLNERVQKAYVKSQAVAVYINGSPDWKKACEDLDLAQQLVHCSIGAYDMKWSEIRYLAEKHGNELKQHWDNVVDSHTIIERKIEDILQKR